MNIDGQSVTVGRARAALLRGPLLFGDSLQIRLLALDAAAEELAAIAESIEIECDNCHGRGTVKCDCDNCTGHDCCMCDGDGQTDPPSRDEIEHYTEAAVFELLSQVRRA